jgi:membrane protease YdiL (CAAX protease family)
MSQLNQSNPTPHRNLSRLTAWRNVIGVTLVNCLVLGVGCFILLGNYLRDRFELFQAAVLQQFGFAAGLAAVLLLVVIWHRARGTSLAELGLGRRTTKVALAWGVALGIAYLVGSYFGASYVLNNVDVLELNWVRFALAPVGIFMAIAEETIMRGFFMTELERAKVGAAIQIFASGICSAAYHTLQNPTPEGFIPSFVLFSVHAGLYVFGRRSLTPTIVAHSMYHVFGEPYLLMMVLATMRS